MKLMTKEIEGKAPRLGETDGMGMGATVVAHYFSCVSGWDWYMTEYEPETGLAFGYVRGFEGELGYFSIPELEEINESAGFCVVERDLHWEPRTIAEAVCGGKGKGMPKVMTRKGDEVDFDAAVRLMDDELREELHLKLAPCSDQEFMEAYERAHLERFGEEFAVI